MILFKIYLKMSKKRKFQPVKLSQFLYENNESKIKTKTLLSTFSSGSSLSKKVCFLFLSLSYKSLDLCKRICPKRFGFLSNKRFDPNLKDLPQKIWIWICANGFAQKDLDLDLCRRIYQIPLDLDLSKRICPSPTGFGLRYISLYPEMS